MFWSSHRMLPSVAWPEWACPVSVLQQVMSPAQQDRAHPSGIDKRCIVLLWLVLGSLDWQHWPGCPVHAVGKFAPPQNKACPCMQ